MTTQNENIGTPGKETIPATPGKQGDRGYTPDTEQREVNKEQETMHTERDPDSLDKDKEPAPPRETELDTDDAEREAGSASLWDRNRKSGGADGDSPSPLR